MTLTGFFEVPSTSETGIEFTNPESTEVSYTFTSEGTYSPDASNPAMNGCTAEGFPSLNPYIQAWYQKNLPAFASWTKYPDRTPYALVAEHKTAGAVTEVGKKATIALKAGETLRFLVNQVKGGYWKNSGSLKVTWSGVSSDFLAQKQKLQPADLQREHKFGSSAAISGNWAIVGADFAGAPGKERERAGAAYIFQCEGGVWEQKHKLQPADLQRDDYFSSSAAISGNWAIVGAKGAGAPGKPYAGAAYIFQCEGGVWQQKQKLQPADLQREDNFGSSAAISGNWAIVGASYAGAPGKEKAGAAYIFQCEGGVWQQKQFLKPADLQRANFFGGSVAISGNWAIVGATGAGAPGKASAGAAYIFQCEGGVWQQKQKLQPADLQGSEYFGGPVAISGNWAIVGASAAGAPDKGHVGAAYIFQCEGGVWQQKQFLQPADLQGNDKFSYSAAIGGNWAIVGALYAGAPGKEYAGAAYIFQCEGGVWQQKQFLQPADLQRGNFFGSSAAISGNWAIVGAYNAGAPGKENAGAAYIFQASV